jgi:Ca2+-binding RTX toxin-like protein
MPIGGIGTDFIVNTTTTQGQFDPSVAVLADGRLVVTFTSDDTGDNSLDCIRARVYGADGAPDVTVNGGNDFIVNTTATNDQAESAVAALADGRFIVTWRSDDTGDGSVDCVRGRIFNADGSDDASVNGGNDFIINTTGQNDQSLPAVTGLPDGRFVAMWDSNDTGDSSSGCIRGRIYDADGTPDLSVNGGNDFIVNTTTTNSQDFPSVTALPDGRFVAMWDSNDPGDGSSGCIRGRIFNVDGSAAGDFVVNTTTSLDQETPSVSALADGRIVASWVSADIGDGSGVCIRARVLSADGAPDLTVNGGNDFIVNTTANANQNRPAVAALADGRFIVTWESDEAGDGSGTCIRGRIYNVDGSAQGGDFIVNASTNQVQDDPSVTPLADGRFLAAWESLDGGDGSARAVRAQIFDPTVFTGTAGADTWRGGSLADHINGGAGNDTLSGLAGNDVVSGEAGNDALSGGDGDDKLLGGLGNDTLTGGAGDDDLFGTLGSDVLNGGSDSDTAFFAGDSADYLVSLLPNGGVQVADQRPGAPYGLDEVYNVEALVFSDGTFAPSAIADDDLAALGDIVWRHTDGSVAAANNDLGVVPNNFQIEGTGDFDADGDADILWRHVDGLVVTWEMQGGNLLATHVLAQVPTGWQIEGTGDFDGDGDSDILWRGSQGQVVTWEMEDGLFVTNHNLPTVPTGWQIAGTGDFDADGDSDILWRGSQGQVVTWEMEDGDLLATHSLPDVPTTFQVAGTGDFDADGDADIIWRHVDGTTVTWEMQGGDLLQTRNFGVVSTSFEVGGTEDFDSDGDADIVWRHVDGIVVTWVMENGALQQTPNFGLVVNSWQIAGTGEFDLV